MHEASIAMSVIGIAEDHCRQAGYSKIKSIAVRVGSASGVMADALETAFDIVKIDTLASNARIIISRVPLGGTCRACHTQFETDEQFILTCPNCDSGDFSLDKGRELDMQEIEVD